VQEAVGNEMIASPNFSLDWVCEICQKVEGLKRDEKVNDGERVITQRKVDCSSVGS
jgi:hypothetical protein